MRITFVINALEAGGAERVLTTVANCWAARGWRVTVISLDDGKTPPFYEFHPAIEHRPLGLAAISNSVLDGFRNNARRISGLRKAIRASEPDAVISFIDKTNVLTLLALLATSIPVIVSERTDPNRIRIRRSWNLLRRLTYLAARHIVVQTETAKAFFPISLQRRVSIIPNPVVLPRFDKADRPPDSSHPARKAVIGLGRLAEVKGFDLLVRAFAIAAPAQPDWDLEIWGDGPQRPLLENLTTELELDGRVRMPGVTRDPFGQLKRADLFVLPSRVEGFPNALCEAMASGLPVVSFDCESGPRHIIRNGVDGLLVPQGDVQALAEAMNRLMSSPEERSRLAGRAPEVLERFGLEHVISMWEHIIEEVCNGREFVSSKERRSQSSSDNRDSVERSRV